MAHKVMVSFHQMLKTIKYGLVAAGLFVVSLIFRIIDLDVCARFPIGTHFLWHVLNAAVLYTVLRGAIAERQHPLSQERK